MCVLQLDYFFCAALCGVFFGAAYVLCRIWANAWRRPLFGRGLCTLQPSDGRFAGKVPFAAFVLSLRRLSMRPLCADSSTCFAGLFQGATFAQAMRSSCAPSNRNSSSHTKHSLYDILRLFLCIFAPFRMKTQFFGALVFTIALCGGFCSFKIGCGCGGSARNFTKDKYFLVKWRGDGDK